jgi:hypothetical protein
MTLPTMSLRVAPQHQQLIRDIGLALRTRPELADVLRDALQTQHGVTERVAERNTDVLHAFQERLTIQSEGLQRIMAFAENIDDRLKTLEQPEALRNTDGNTDVLRSILDRLAALEEREPRMVRIEALEAHVTKLDETMAAMKDAPSANGRQAPATHADYGRYPAPGP